MAVNYFFNVPVKILSTHLVVMTLLLLLRDGEVIWKFFLKGESVRLEVIQMPQFPKRWRVAGLSFKFLLTGYVLIYGAYEVFGYQKQYASFNSGEFDGYYVVKKFAAKPETQAYTNWKRMNISFNKNATVALMNDSLIRFSISKDSVNKKLLLTGSHDTTIKCVFSYRYIDSTKFLLKGTIRSDSVSITFDKFKD